MIITPILVIFLVIVFILLFLFLNTVDKRKWLTALISVILTPFAFFFVFYPLLNIVSTYHHQKYFNTTTWLEKPGLRYEMIDETITSDTLIGKPKPEIELLLGKAEWLTWDETKKSHNPDKWNYGLGIEPGAFTTDKSNVELTFKNNKVLSLKTYTEPITFDEKE